METTRPSPKEYLKARRPERFSDSTVETRHDLSRTLLECHLESLTRRNQEADFERFARELAKLEICPNLRSSTGPMGGGDSKVDTETYPVAEQLSLSWHIGHPAAGTERWAFAFSTMARAKVTSKISADIAKIAQTNRGYTRAFFISSQYIKDSTRSKLEDKLSKNHGISVTIHDRSWILDRVFTNRREALAIEHLRVQLPLALTAIHGPNDVERKQVLVDIENRLTAFLAQPVPPLAVVDDALQIAILSSELELPRMEQEGFFARAVRIADKYGTKHKRLLARYQYAWVSYFWLEDLDLFTQLYEEVESLAKETRNFYELELLNNLWMLLRNAVNNLGLDGVACSFPAHTHLLRREFERYAGLRTMPSAALQAQTWLLNMQFDGSESKEVTRFFGELNRIVRESEHLVGYSVVTLLRLIEEFGELYATEPAYEELLDLVAGVTERRNGDISAAHIWLRQGARQAETKPEDALRTVGKALNRLLKNESQTEMVFALQVCAYAYESAGLLWAARGALVTAAYFATEVLWKYEKVTSQQVELYAELKRLELMLGRVPHALEWHRADQVMRAVLSSTEGKVVPLYDAEFDGCLADIFLKSELSALEEFERLPDALDELCLPRSRISLAFALGDEEEMKRGLEPEDKDLLTPKFFQSLLEPPADTSVLPTSMNSQTAVLRSRILGCDIVVTAENNQPCVEVGESFLAALESFLATGFSYQILAHLSQLSVLISKNESQSEMIECNVDSTNDEPILKITCASFNPHQMSPDTHRELKLSMSKVMAYAYAYAFFAEEVESAAEKLANDQAIERSHNFSGSFAVIGSILGGNPRFTANAWAFNRRRHALQRTKKWNDGLETSRGLGDATDSVRDPLLSLRELHQTKLVTVVHYSLWERAGQGGIGFSIDLNSPPSIILIFDNGEIAKRIFSRWHAELGETDPKERLRLTITKGINVERPHWYRLTISANLLPSEKIEYFHGQFYRTWTVKSSDGDSLGCFLNQYYGFAEFLLVPGERQTSGNVELFQDHMMRLKRLHVRDAYEIGPDDPDILSLAPDDCPVIPSNMRIAPVTEALHRLNELLPKLR